MEETGESFPERLAREITEFLDEEGLLAGGVPDDTQRQELLELIAYHLHISGRA